METVRVDKSSEESLLSGHLWIFSNQIMHRPDGLPDGELVEVSSDKGRFLGIGYHNKASLIAIRMLVREKVPIDEEFFRRRVTEAVQLRGSCYGGNFRAVNSESDFLPGLIVDRYGDRVVVQLLTYGMERQKENVLGAVRKVLSPRAIVVRNDSASRREEGLSPYVEVTDGTVDGPLVIEEGALRFLVDLLAGHKTGFYFDQRENRLLMKEYAQGRQVLDLFSYSGGFGLNALYFGARSVTFVDASEQALALCKENLKLNGLSGGTLVKADGFEFLKTTDEEYEVMVLDPPSFIKSKKKLKEGERGYIDLHKKAIRKLSDRGYLLTFSCSHHMRRSRFRDIVRLAAYGVADMHLIRELFQSGDHPVLLTVPETDYLKGLLVRVKKRSSD